MTTEDLEFLRDHWMRYCLREQIEDLYDPGILLINDDPEFWFTTSFKNLRRELEENASA